MFKNKIGIMLIGALLAMGVVGPGSRSEASLLLNTPTGLADGAQFRFVFVTPGTRDATSTSIGDYNSFVNTQAGGAMFNDTIVTWYAIASTSAVNAKDNITGLQTTPIYLANGTKVANDLSVNAGGLWSGSLAAPINNTLTAQLATFVWTGANPDGTGLGGNELGTGGPIAGFSSESASYWILAMPGSSPEPLSLYGISEVLTAQTSAVPEPSTYALFSLGLGGLALLKRRQKKA